MLQVVPGKFLVSDLQSLQHGSFGCVALDKSIYVSEPWFLHLFN